MIQHGSPHENHKISAGVGHEAEDDAEHEAEEDDAKHGVPSEGREAMHCLGWYSASITEKTHGQPFRDGRGNKPSRRPDQTERGTGGTKTPRATPPSPERLRYDSSQ